MAPPTRGERRRLNASERRLRILNAAVQVFAERGYEAASMGEIAARAGVVASVLYDHVPSKRALYIELLERNGDALIERSTGRLPGNATPVDLVRSTVDAFFAFVEDDPFVWRFLFRDPPPDSDAAEAHQRVRDRATQAIAAIIEPLLRARRVRFDGVPAERAAVVLAQASRAAVEGLAGWWFEHRGVSREQVVDIAVRLLYDGFHGILEGVDD